LITTASLDGETGAKVRSTPPPTRHFVLSDLLSTAVVVSTGEPCAELYEFSAMLETRPEPLSASASASASVSHPPTATTAEPVDKVPIDSQHLLLKGSRLKQTRWVYGLALMTGGDTKVAANQRAAPHKISSAERKLNVFLVVMILFMLTMCLASVLLRHHLNHFVFDVYWPIAEFDNSSSTAEWDDDSFASHVWSFLQFVILFSYLIPISLYVTLEMEKLVGALLISWDEGLTDPSLPNEPAMARTR
jgi:phospholipid-translocating ATPase